ncbi:helix-turn-helix domain-containing protein [Sorangium sp. So ce363]|uniref:helix-turn-helix domain-containing protein n=1 Tax=Sorangium sp. So ce363 TaxID=3133304 RepID=UPI003F5ED644
MFAGELVEAGLGVAADRLVAAERQLAETEHDLADLEVADAEATWMLGALRDFANVWCLMTTEKRGCLLRALVATVRVTAHKGGHRRRRGRELQRRRPLAGGRRMTSPDSPMPQDRHILTGPLFRRRCSRVLLTEQPPPPKPESVRRPAKVARMLALAHHPQGAIDRRLVAGRTAVARKLGLTRARVTQLLDLLLLAPDFQEAVPALEAIDGAERTLRAGTWGEQREAWVRLQGIRNLSRDAARVLMATYPPSYSGNGWKPAPSTARGPEWMSDDILTVLEVADRTVQTMAQKGEIPAHKVRGQWRFRRTDIDDWIQEQTTARREDGGHQASPPSRCPSRSPSSNRTIWEAANIQRSSAVLNKTRPLQPPVPSPQPLPRSAGQTSYMVRDL